MASDGPDAVGCLIIVVFLFGIVIWLGNAVGCADFAWTRGRPASEVR